MKLKYLLVGLVLLLVAGGAVISQPAGDAQPAAPQYPVADFNNQIPCKVMRVIDGATVDIQFSRAEIRRVRLIGVDAPELDAPYYKESTKFLDNLIMAEAVYFQFGADGDTVDKSGRWPAYLYRAPDGLFVNLEIIRQGYGRADTAFPFKYTDLFAAYEKRARAGQKGLWASEASNKDAAEEKPKDAGIMVYITTSGRRYHRKGCKDLLISRTEVTLKEAKRRNYDPCKRCGPPQQ